MSGNGETSLAAACARGRRGGQRGRPRPAGLCRRRVGASLALCRSTSCSTAA